MTSLKKLSLQKEIEQDVQQMEQEIANHPELEQIHVTEEMDAALLAKIQEYEAEKEKEKAIQNSREYEKTKVVRYRKRKKRWIVAVAAVLVLVLGLGMTSMGSKSYWKELLDILIGEESARVINVEDMDTQKTADIDEIQICKEISEKLNRDIVWMRYKPERMEIESYEIDEDLQLARLFFRYKGELIRYSIYAGEEDSSWTEKEEDKIVTEYIQNINDVEVKIKELEKPYQKDIRRSARFEYKGLYYEIKGIIEKEELEKILDNLYFL